MLLSVKHDFQYKGKKRPHQPFITILSDSRAGFRSTPFMTQSDHKYSQSKDLVASYADPVVPATILSISSPETTMRSQSDE